MTPRLVELQPEAERLWQERTHPQAGPGVVGVQGNELQASAPADLSRGQGVGLGFGRGQKAWCPLGWVWR